MMSVAGRFTRHCVIARRTRLTFNSLAEKFSTYRGSAPIDLQEEHRIAFELEHPLGKAEFNRKQHLMIIGSAGDDELIRNIDYWRSRGLSLSFVPYRVYKIKGEQYFEFFSLAVRSTLESRALEGRDFRYKSKL